MKSVLILLFVLIAGTSMSTHIVGGEVYYDSLGNDQYRVTFEVYRDCSPGVFTGYDDPLHYTAFHANGAQFAEFFINAPVPDTLPIAYDDPCVTPPNDVCIERAFYVDTITLPATPDGYYITYQRCCWSNAIMNLTSPGTWGITITTSIPGTNLVQAFDNNCAKFNNYPPIALCSDNTLTFDHSATDLDGDSLVYYLCDPLTLSSQAAGGTEPSPEPPAPYGTVPWETGFSGTQPFGPGSTVTIDPQTGMMDITPSLQGTFVMAVCVEEWRNGVLINQKSRTFGYRVLVCDVETPMQVDVVGAGTLIEDCGSTCFVISRDDSTSAVDLQLEFSGDAINGEDYNALPSTLTLPVNVGKDTICVTPTLDGIFEGDESLTLSVIVENPCENTYDTTTAFITIQDYINMQMTWDDSINVCDELGEYGTLNSAVQHGVPPYFYSWNPNYGNSSTITFPATDLNPNLNLFSLEVFDACGKNIQSDPIKVYNQCVLVPPNVITANNDNINDLFVIANIEDYDRVHVQIFNRWGNLVYDSPEYKNDWNGEDMNGNPLTEGVYTYTVTPESVKYTYDDVEKTLYTAHGFVHIVRN